MPFLNRASVLSEAIESVLAQTYQDWELIAVDDGSTDASFSILKKYSTDDPRIKIYKRTSEKKGPAVCRNIGVSNASGEYLIFLDSDDLLAPTCCSSRLEIMDKHPELDFGIFNMGVFENNFVQNTDCFNKHAESNEAYLSLFLSLQTPWTITSPMWRKTFFCAVKGFNENFLVKTDPELHARVLILHEPKYQYFASQPNDCFYRINYFDTAKSAYFISASILYRVKYFHAVVQYLEVSKKYSLQQFKKSISAGIVTFYKSIFISNVNQYSEDYHQFLNWSRSKSLIGFRSYAIIFLLGFVKKRPNWFIRKLKIEGILFHLLH
jgi:glycosyltransferase involved in cell wall biosynthesis